MSADPNSTSTSDAAQERNNSDQTDSGAAENFSDEFLRELTGIGKSFVEVVEAAWNSEERKNIEGELKEGLANVAANLESGYQRVSDSDKAQDLLNRAEDAATNLGEQVRSSEAVMDLADGLIDGLRSLGTHLEQMARDIQKGATSKPEGDSEAQDIPIEEE